MTLVKSVVRLTKQLRAAIPRWPSLMLLNQTYFFRFLLKINLLSTFTDALASFKKKTFIYMLQVLALIVVTLYKSYLRFLFSSSFGTGVNNWCLLKEGLNVLLQTCIYIYSMV